jgi:hypothetical protein
MVDLFFQCPNCGHSVGDDLEPVEENKDIKWAYTKTTDKNKWDAIKKSEINLKNKI